MGFKLWNSKHEREKEDNFANLYAIIKTIGPTTYKMDCPTALNCLLVASIPATIEHHSSLSASAITVSECIQHFITTTDLLKLNMVTIIRHC
ncbi:Vacuolar protein sorting-associated [Cinnamomum micranthum f. kanehirae]|uniref:Vacuolar protein sorting-associated n=1 Tax=Cinnamomum micranthum f. kanehirae TaxID=337451 RepID=A0A443PCZ5_9MAGN|nr:Vacuolar protein sorting-associated [Cinnamomum micranthum f. kanehirae]